MQSVKPWPPIDHVVFVAFNSRRKLNPFSDATQGFILLEREKTVFTLFSSSIISILWQIVMVTTESRGVIRYLMPSGYPNPEVALCGCRQKSRVWKIPIENSTKAKMIDWLRGADRADQSIMVYSFCFHGIRPYLFLLPFATNEWNPEGSSEDGGNWSALLCIYKDW